MDWYIEETQSSPHRYSLNQLSVNDFIMISRALKFADNYCPTEELQQLILLIRSFLSEVEV